MMTCSGQIASINVAASSMAVLWDSMNLMATATNRKLTDKPPIVINHSQDDSR